MINNTYPKTMKETLLDEGCITLCELCCIETYTEEYDKSILADFIRTNERISQQMRDFIADVLIGTIKRKPGSKSLKIKRDAAIWDMARKLKNKGVQLTPNAKGDENISETLAESFNVSGDSIIKAIQRMDKYFEDNKFIIDENGAPVFNHKIHEDMKKNKDELAKKMAELPPDERLLLDYKFHRINSTELRAGLEKLEKDR